MKKLFIVSLIALASCKENEPCKTHFDIIDMDSVSNLHYSKGFYKMRQAINTGVEICDTCWIIVTMRDGREYIVQPYKPKLKIYSASQEPVVFDSCRSRIDSTIKEIKLLIDSIKSGIQ